MQLNSIKEKDLYRRYIQINLPKKLLKTAEAKYLENDIFSFEDFCEKL